MLIVSHHASFKATEDIPAGRRVKYVAPMGVALAGANEASIGVSQLHRGKTIYKSGEPAAVHLHHLPVLCEAAGAFADGATVQRMASGKVDDTGSGAGFAMALEAAGGSGDIVQVLPLGGAGNGQSTAVPADIAASTNIDAVPGTFADLAAVRTYLAGANVIPNIEGRLDALEAKVNAILAALR